MKESLGEIFDLEGWFGGFLALLIYGILFVICGLFIVWCMNFIATKAGENVYQRNLTICQAKTKSMGFRWRYDADGGCLIEVKEGVWIPLENYRYKP